MNANPALGLVAGLSIAESKGLTGSDATKVAMVAMVADFPMGIVLASVIAGREADAAAAANAATTGSTGTGTTTKPPTTTPAPAPGKSPSQDPAVVLGNEFAQLQTAAAQLAEHESQATVDTKLELLVQEIREAREHIDEQNRAALQRDRAAREELGESEATEEREEEAAEREREGGKPAGSRGS
jgi:predicted lipid-binding transport protein (Tim44 family)